MNAVNTASVTGNRYAPGWPNALAMLAVTLAATLFLYRETAISMAHVWLRSETFAHGWIVPPVTIYLIWMRRAALLATPPRPTYAGVALLAVAVAGWVLAKSVSVIVVQQLALVAMCQILVLTLLGWRAMYCVAFPLAFLFFAVPFGEGLIPPLMEFTARFTVRALELTGIPVYRDGLHLSVPSGDFEVARACSGIRYLISSVALGSLFAYLTYHSWRRRAIFMLLAVTVPVLANGLRAYMIVMLAHLSGMRLAVGVDHLIYGWVFFGLVMFVLFWVGMAFRDSPESGVSGATSSSTAAPAGMRGFVTAGAAALMLLLIGPNALDRLESDADLDGIAPAAPVAAAPWQGPFEDSGDWQPLFGGATAQYRAVYRFEGQELQLFAAWYANQRQGAELINAGNRVYDGTRWLMLAQGRASFPLASGPTDLRSTRIYYGSREALVWHWYQIGTQATGSDTLVKFIELWQRFTGSYRGSAAIAIATEVGVDESAAAELLKRFLAQHEEALLECLFGDGGACAR